MASSSSDPTLGLTDASWPPAHAQNAARSAPQHRPPASTTQLLAPGNPASVPAASPATGRPVQPDSVAAADTQLLQILQQQQQQQHQMMQQQQQ